MAQHKRDSEGIKQFCNNLRDSGLMNGATIRSVWESFDTKKPRNAEELANELVRRKKITPYQYERLKESGAEGLKIDQYTILDRIGSGGMGEVLKARHERMQRYVALKIISNKLLDSAEALERFEQETRAAAQLAHPNIVAAYDAGEKNGTHYLVLEYVDGHDLSTVLNRSGPLRVPIALDYVIQAAEGLQYSHRKGIVHRDIKPANLLVDSTGVVKILDMGLAFMVQRADAAGETTNQRLTQHGQVMGTSAYMAPEQAIDIRKADARSDIYSLGCTMYDLLVGHPPYEGETHMGVIVAHREQPIPSICSERTEVSTAVDQVFQRMVAKDPVNRYGSMGEVIAALRACTADPGALPAAAPAPFSPANAAPAPAREWSADGSHSGPSVAVADRSKAQATHQESPQQDTFRQIAAQHDTVVSRKKATAKALPRMAVLASVALLLLLGVGGGVLAVMLSIQTPEGTLLVESADPQVKIAVKQGGEIVEFVDADDNWKIALKEGKYELELTGGKDQFRLDQHMVIVKRNKTERLRVTFEPTVAANKPQPVNRRQGKAAGNQAASNAVALNNSSKYLGTPQAAIASSTPLVDKLPVLTPLHNLLGRREGAIDLCFTPDGKTLASCDRSGHIVLWDVDSGQFEVQFHVPFSASELAFSPDGKSLAVVGGRYAAAIYSTAEGKLIHSLHGITEEEERALVEKNKLYPTMSCLAYAPNGKRLFTASNAQEVFIWETSSGKLLKKVPAHNSSIYGLACSPDGRRFATCSYDGTTQLFNAETYEQLQMLKHGSESTVYDLQFSADSKTLYTCGNTTHIVAWDVETGKEMSVMFGHGAPVYCLSVSAEEKMIASLGTGDHSLRFWDVPSSKPLSVLRNASPEPRFVEFSPTDPTLFATASENATVQLWRYEGDEIDDRGNLRTAKDGTVIVFQEVADDHLVAPPWQSFKAPVTGTLSKVEFQPLMAEGSTGNLSVYLGEGLRGEKIYTQKYTIERTDTTDWRTFPMTGPVQLEEGKTYTIELEGAQGMMHSNANRYGDGKGGIGDMAFRFHFMPAQK